MHAAACVVELVGGSCVFGRKEPRKPRGHARHAGVTPGHQSSRLRSGWRRLSGNNSIYRRFDRNPHVRRFCRPNNGAARERNLEVVLVCPVDHRVPSIDAGRRVDGCTLTIRTPEFERGGVGLICDGETEDSVEHNQIAWPLECCREEEYGAGVGVTYAAYHTPRKSKHSNQLARP